MTFTWLHAKGVLNDEGYTVERTGRFTIKYSEGDMVMLLEGESMFGDLDGREFGFSFYDSWRTVGWQPPYERNPISSSDRMRLRANVSNALAFMNGRARFE